MSKSYAEIRREWVKRENAAVDAARAAYAAWVEREEAKQAAILAGRIARLEGLGAERRLAAAIHLFAHGHEPSWRAGGRCAECDRLAAGFWAEEVQR